MNVFVYGTLLVPKIWEAVTLTPGLVSHPATLAGYEIRRVSDAVYPVIFASSDSQSSVPGRVFLEVPDSALQRLDRFEDSFYDRLEVFPQVPEIGQVAAQAYVAGEETYPAIVSEDTWTLAEFERHDLVDFWDRIFAG